MKSLSRLLPLLIVPLATAALGERRADAWTKYTTGTPPTAAYQNFVLELGAAAGNTITIAPSYVSGNELVSLLTNTHNSTSGGFKYEYYDGSAWNTTTHYYEGIWIDGGGSNVWTWKDSVDTAGELYMASSAGGTLTQFGSGFASFASDIEDNWYATGNSSGSTCTPTGAPNGYCGHECTFDGTNCTWATKTWGAEQVTVDRGSSCTVGVIGATYYDTYVLDEVGRVWSRDRNCDAYYPPPPDWDELTDAQCSSGTVTFLQIAAKNGRVYGIDDKNLTSPYYSDIWYYTASNGCWTKLASINALSLATDTDNTGGHGVWATNYVGDIYWAAQP